MKSKVVEGIIMSSIELTLCMRILGNEAWYDIPVDDKEEDLEGRLLNGLLTLIRHGYLTGDGDKFTATEQMKQLFSPLLGKYCHLSCCQANGLPIHLYLQNESAFCLELINEDSDVRVFSLSIDEVYDYLFANLDQLKKVFDEDHILTKEDIGTISQLLFYEQEALGVEFYVVCGFCKTEQGILRLSVGKQAEVVERFMFHEMLEQYAVEAL